MQPRLFAMTAKNLVHRSSRGCAPRELSRAFAMAAPRSHSEGSAVSHPPAHTPARSSARHLKESISGLAGLVLAIPVGILVDALHTRRAFLLKLSTIFAVATAVLGIAACVTDIVLLLYAALVMLGIFAELASSTSEALFADSIPAGRCPMHGSPSGSCRSSRGAVCPPGRPCARWSARLHTACSRSLRAQTPPSARLLHMHALSARPSHPPSRYALPASHLLACARPFRDVRCPTSSRNHLSSGPACVPACSPPGSTLATIRLASLVVPPAHLFPSLAHRRVRGKSSFWTSDRP